MSNLNPGGSRAKGPRVFTAAGVARVCQQAKISDVDKASGSVATSEHKHSREIQRRLRQAAAKAARA